MIFVLLVIPHGRLSYNNLIGQIIADKPATCISILFYFFLANNRKKSTTEYEQIKICQPMSFENYQNFNNSLVSCSVL